MPPLALTLASFRAEWLKLRYRPATWVLGLLLAASIFTLGYALLYVGILLIEQSATQGDQSVGSEFLRADMAPARVVGHVLPLLHQIGGPIALILGALAIGSEYGWGTVKTILTQRPGRLALLSGKLLALALLLVVFTLTALAVGLLGSFLFSAILGDDLAFPAATTLLAGIGAGWLILAAWMMLGVALATALRGTAFAIGLGLIYGLVLENVTGIVAFFVEQVRTVQQYFLGASTSALAGNFAPAVADGPAVAPISSTQATIVLLVYVAIFAVIAALFFRQRDVT